MYYTQDRGRSPFVSVEALEGRQLLSGEPWGTQATLINQDDAAINYPKITGAGETIAIIDSGVDYKHPSLGGGIGANYKVIAGYDFQSGDADPMSDTYAHGTGAAGIAAADPYVYKGKRYQGIAPDANVVALRENSSAGVKAALEWVLANRTKYNIVAVNLTDYAGTSPSTYKTVLQNVIAAGVFVSHPAGNGGAGVAVGASVDPADVSVGSVNLSGQISSFTQRGSELDMLAPGEKVTLPYYDVGTKKAIYVDSADGTSWASPAVAAAALLIKQVDARYTPVQILKILQDSGQPVYDSVSKLTYKRLDLNAAIALAYARRPGTPQAPSAEGPTPVPAPVSAAQSPFGGKATVIGAGLTTLQAENFDAGGEGVSYHDTDTANRGGSTYRSGAGVDVQNATGGTGHYVGYVRAGEWLEYTVNVATAGTYALSARVASLQAGGTFHVEVDGVAKTGEIHVANTGGWQNWSTVDAPDGVALSAGQHVIRVKADSAGALGYVANFDSFAFVRTTSASSNVLATAFSAQSGGVTSTNGYVGSLDAGDWVAYAGIDFGDGVSSLTATLAAAPGWAGKKIQLRLDSPTGAVIGTLVVPNTGSWTTFKTVKVAVTKIVDIHDLYLTVPTGQGVGNLKSFTFG